MIAGLVIVLTMLAMVGTYYGVAARRAGTEERRLRAAPGDDEAKRLALLMARCLDHALTDPVLRQSMEWEDQAQALVNRYYGKESK